MSSQRSSSIEPTEVQEILNGTGAMAGRPSPTDHVATPSSPTSSTGRQSFQSHSRTMSQASVVSLASVAGQRSNRFSMSFPVQPTGATSPTRAQSPTREAPHAVADSLISGTGPTDASFLTAIATQERRVLELKEELSKAEADLYQLKRQWAQHEAQKKRSEAKKLTKLQPLQTALPAADKEDDTDGSNAWMQQEMERRKALLNNQKTGSRTVFSGSKHTRTLSLLSPIRGPASVQATQRPPRPPRKDSLSEPARRSQEAETGLAPITPAATNLDLTAGIPELADSNADFPDRNIDHAVLLQTGKKMATELRDGLWTFWEDLRQATVGEEGVPIPPPSRKASNQTLRTAKKQESRSSLRPSSRGSTTSSTASSIQTKRHSPARKHTKSATMSMSVATAPALADPSFWTEHGFTTLQSTTPARLQKSTKHTKSASKAMSSSSSDAAWDAWDDSPKDSRSGSTTSETNTLPTTVSDDSASSPRLSIDLHTNASDDTIRPIRDSSAISRKDPIPWPALGNFGPKALRRTASHLMSEWERSLTPSPGKEFTGPEDEFFGSRAEAEATSQLAMKRD